MVDDMQEPGVGGGGGGVLGRTSRAGVLRAEAYESISAAGVSSVWKGASGVCLRNEGTGVMHRRNRHDCQTRRHSASMLAPHSAGGCARRGVGVTLSSSSAVDICARCDGDAVIPLTLVRGWGQGGAVQLQPCCNQA